LEAENPFGLPHKSIRFSDSFAKTKRVTTSSNK
jgi:hypothetical protein